MSPTWREDFEIIMERRWVIPKKGNDQRMAHGMEMMESEERADPWNTEEDEHIESYKEAYERMTQVCVQSRIEGVESW